MYQKTWFTSSPVKLRVVVSLRITFRICIVRADPPAMSKSYGGTRRNRYFHGPLRFIARASCLPRIRIDFVWEEKVAFCRKDGNSERGISLLSYQTRNPRALLYSHSLSLSVSPRATGYKSFPNIGLTYRFENSAARKQPICIRITRNVPRDVRLLDASASSHTTTDAARRRNDPAREWQRVKRKEKAVTIQRRFRSMMRKFLPVHYYRASLKVRSRNWLMPTQLSILIYSWLIKISERDCDLSCFRLRSSARVISHRFTIDIGLLKWKRKVETIL